MATQKQQTIQTNNPNQDIDAVVKEVSELISGTVRARLSGIYTAYSEYKETHDALFNIPAIQRAIRDRSQTPQVKIESDTMDDAHTQCSSDMDDKFDEALAMIDRLQRDVRTLQLENDALRLQLSSAMISSAELEDSENESENENITLVIEDTDSALKPTVQPEVVVVKLDAAPTGEVEVDDDNDNDDDEEAEAETDEQEEQEDDNDDEEEDEEEEDDENENETGKGKVDEAVGDDEEAEAEEEEEDEEVVVEESSKKDEEVVEDEEEDDGEEDEQEEQEVDEGNEEEEEDEGQETGEEGEEDVEEEGEAELENEEEVEEVEEETAGSEEVEVFEVEIKGKTYFTTDETSGVIYESLPDGDIGDDVGSFVKGKPVFKIKSKV